MPQVPKEHDPRDEYLRAYRKHCRIETDLLDGFETDTISSWRIFKIIAEFVNGFELLRKYGLAASIFGSARSTPDMPIYQDAVRLGGYLAEDGFVVMTGGGGGIMEAANKGALEAGGTSVGLNIRLPEEQALNGYVNDAETFHYFFTRKVSLAFASEVYIYYPGGFGTLDEMFEILTLVQTKKIKEIPIILVGRTYWEPLVAWFRQVLLAERHTINPEDLELFHVVDTAEEAHELIKRTVEYDC
ncbi:TIGR00730 family Rossman fold protein [Patescibacteria group bacterium]|jgi:uncharacterized protein (TIGR00730 family)|nr:TIGR00730 family Rossman fold protein [Patescibacteria group bacterium]